jgi:hypothetical protein
VIVVIGLPAYSSPIGGEGSAGGLAVDVAAAAHARGASAELVGKVGDDGAGDAVVLALGRLGIGHAALLRDPAHPTPVISVLPGDTVVAETGADSAAGLESDDEPAADAPATELLPRDPAERPTLEAGDLSLALRYLAEARVMVAAEPLPDAAVAALVEGAAFAGAHLVVLLAPGTTPPSLPRQTTVLEAPAADDGSFGRLVGAFAAALDAGSEPAAAFDAAVRGAGWEPVVD